MSRTIRLSVALLLGLGIALTLPAAANAAAYRYWGYYQLDGTTWKFATKGADQVVPADGAVEGWRFAVGTEDVTRFPRATPAFADICGGTKAETGKKRVAVVIDYGRKADSADNTEPPAPVGRCAVVPTTATGLEVLSKVASVRTDKALICGVDGVPASGCGDEVKTVPAAAKAADSAVALKIAKADEKDSAKADDDSHTGTYIGIGVAALAVIAVGGIALNRRRTA